MRIAVTGAAGFIGSRLCRELLAAGHQVSGLARRPPLPEGVTPLIADLGRLERLPPFDVVVHTAALSPGPGVNDADFEPANVATTRRLLECAAAAGVTRLLFCSSVDAYGQVAGLVDETTPTAAPGAYGRSKLACERLLEAQPYPTLALRLPGILGPELRGNWLSGVVRRARQGGPVAIYNPEAPFNNAVHVGDLVRFIRRLCEQGWQDHPCFPLGAAEPLTIRETVAHVIDRLASPSTIEVRPPPGPAFHIDCRTAERFGFRPPPLRRLLDRFIDENSANNSA